MRKIIISEEFDPYFNIAAEYRLFLEAEEDLHLYLWRNDSAVIVGRNQNLYAECDLTYMKEQGIRPVRRFSGGGAVYHDRGNVNFTLITKAAGANPGSFIEFIRQAMLRLGVDCQFSGRNDLLHQGQKFSGHAYYTDDDNYMYHGAILVDVDFGRLGRALTPSRLKLQSKGVESVRSRVVNLSAIDPAITPERVMAALAETFACDRVEYIGKESFTAPEEALLASHSWLYGQAPGFDAVVERRYPFGSLSAAVTIADGAIQTAKIHTDSLSFHDFALCEAALVGLPFDEQAVLTHLDRYMAEHLDLA